MKNKQKYINYCLENDVLIFNEPSWLDATCGQNNWEVICIEEKNTIKAFLPYFEGKKGNIQMPVLTPFISLILIDIPTENQKKNSYETKFLDLIINAFEEKNIDYFRFKFYYEFKNWLPFYWRKYSQSTRYSYVLEDISDIDVVYSGIKSSVKRNIKKAEKKLEIVDSENIEEFYRLYDLTFKRQNINTPYSLVTFKQLDDTLKRNGTRKIFLAKNNNGQFVASVYIVWDKTSAYYLGGGVDPDFRSFGGQIFLLWHSIKFCSRIVKKFDFEGSMVKGIGIFFSTFGGKLKPYFDVTKDFKSQKGNKIIKVTRILKQVVQTILE